MAKMIDQKPEYQGEAKFWSAAKDYLPADIVVYNNREINGREYDFCLFLPDCGILIVEVKGWQSDKIQVKGVDEIHVEGYSTPQRSPKKQARAYRFAMLNKVMDRYHVSPLVFDMVCYPFISKTEYLDTRLDVVCEEKFVLFKEDLQSADALLQKIAIGYQANKGVPHDEFTPMLMKKLRMELEPEKPVEPETSNTGKPYSILTIYRNTISEQMVRELTEHYLSGTKYIAFFANQDDYKKTIDSLNATFSKRNIEPKGNSLEIGYRNGLKTTGDSCRTFNLELYFSDKINEVTDHDVLIEEGNLPADSQAILIRLSEITPFNLQQYLVEHSPVDSNTLVQAGAGTGKTFSMVSRVAFLCNKQDNPVTNIEEEIALVTFTNDAATNMRVRLKQMFTNYFVLTGNPRFLKYVEDIDRSNISTIHKFALAILRGQPLYTGLGSQFKIRSDENARADIYEYNLNEFLTEMEEENPNFTNEIPVPIYELRQKIIGLSDRLMAKSVDLEDIKPGELGIPTEGTLPFFNQLLEKVVFPSEIEYLSNIKEENRVDLKEIIILLGRMLDRTEKIDDLKLRYLFIDEFQDTDDAQIRVFQKLQRAINQDCRLFVVGDLKQSIYRFRGARLSAFDQLRSGTLFPWAEYYLRINYRTDHRLLNQYHTIFSGMGALHYLPYRAKEDQLVSNLTLKNGAEDGRLVMVPCHGKDETQFEEALLKTLNYQISVLKNILMQQNLSKEERTIAILVRSNWQVQKIIKITKKAGISVDIKSGGELFQLESSLDLYKLVLALQNSTNPVYLVSFIESNYTDLSLSYQKLHGITASSKVEYLTTVLDQFFQNRMKKTWRQLVSETGTKPILFVLKQIYDSLCPWKQYSHKTQEQRYYMANYEYLLECIIKYSKIDSLTLTSVLHYLEINILTKQQHLSREMEDDEKEIRILCITVHKSKGLEYGTVILPYADENLGDLRKAKLEANYSKSKLSYSVTFENKVKEKNTNYIDSQEIEEQIAEETRILYVALTRAIRNCIWIKNVDRNPDISWSTLLASGSDDWEENEQIEFSGMTDQKQSSGNNTPGDTVVKPGELVLEDDFGMNMRDTKWIEIWDNAVSLVDQKSDQETLKEIQKQSGLFEGREKPFSSCVFTVNEEEYECVLLWKNSKVMLFTEENMDGYRAAKNCGWTCFIVSDKAVTPELLATSIKER